MTTSYSTRLAAIAIAIMGLACAATAASAEARKARTAKGRTHVYVRPALPSGFYERDGIVYSSTGSVVPAYVLATPEKCWVEDGYNRWSTCDASNPR
jgi:hypothetical protein